MYLPVLLVRNVRSNCVVIKVHGSDTTFFFFFLVEIRARCDRPEPLLNSSTVKMLNNSSQKGSFEKS